MKIVVTGGSGFIGTRLTGELLKAGHSVKIYDKAESEAFPELVVLGDVRDREALIEAARGYDAIYNLAAEHADNVTPLSLYEEVNVLGARNVVEAARANAINQIVFTSSVAIYGLNRGEPDEGFDARPFNEYGRTKYEAEKIFVDWARDNADASLSILRPSVIFGEKNRGNVYNLINQIKSGKFVMVGSGKNKKSMGYVGSIANFLASLTDAKPGVEIYNFAGKPDMSSRQIVDIITSELGHAQRTRSIPLWLGMAAGYTFDLLALVSGRKFNVSSIRIKKFTADTTINTDKLQATDFVPPYSLEEGLRQMVKSMK